MTYTLETYEQQMSELRQLAEGGNEIAQLLLDRIERTQQKLAQSMSETIEGVFSRATVTGASLGDLTK